MPEPSLLNPPGHATRVALCATAAIAGVGYISYVLWRKFTCASDSVGTPNHNVMGQNQTSNCVVEIAPKSWVEETESDSWRIRVNPGVESEELRATDAAERKSDWECDPDVKRRRIYRLRRIRTEPNGTPAGAALLPRTKRVPRLRLLAEMQGFSKEQFENQIRSAVDALYGISKVLSPEEAKCLVLSLELRHDSVLLKTLTSISNFAAFAINQDLLREFGAVSALKELLYSPDLSDSARVMLVQCIANMSVNQTNHLLFQSCVETLGERLESDRVSELEKAVSVQALTNLSVQVRENRAPEFSRLVPCLFQKLWFRGNVNMPVLKLLVNLSCSSDVVPYLLAAKAPTGFVELLDPTSPTEVLVRVLTFVQHLASTVECLGIDRGGLPLAADAQFQESLFAALFNEVGIEEVLKRLELLVCHQDSEVVQRAATIQSIYLKLRQCH